MKSQIQIFFEIVNIFTLQTMSENSFNQNVQDGKPVNINISFNISRKQVTQNINTSQQDRSFNLKKSSIDEDSSNDFRPKKNYRPVRTPQLAQTDRNVYNKEYDFARPNQQFKMKKKGKRSSGDYTADKTSLFPFYQQEMERSLPNHKRGQTMSFTKKESTETGLKKKRPSKVDESLKQNKTSESGKNQGKAVKSIKGILSKIISSANNDLSKKSLPLPNVPSKSKYSNSASLTSRKVGTSKQTARKRSSKSQILSNAKTAEQRQRHSSDPNQQQQIQRNQLLMKLSNFKSIQNSMLISQVQRMQEKEDYIPYDQKKKMQKNKIVIKTDQSIECIDQIHDFQRNSFKEFFLRNDDTSDNDEVQQQKTEETHEIIETYIKMLNQHHSKSNIEDLLDQQIDIQRIQPIQKQKSGKIKRAEIFFDDNYLNSSDLSKVEDLLVSPQNKRVQKPNPNKQTFIQIQQIQSHPSQSSNQKTQKSQQKQKNLQIVSNNINENLFTKPQQIVQAKQEQMIIKRQETSAQKIHSKSANKQSSFLKQQPDEQTFRPFISSQLGKQLYMDSPTAGKQRARLNQIKRQEVEKFKYLLDYIKLNIKKQASTQQVLQHVYEYLSQAKVQLLKESRLSSKIQETLVPKIQRNNEQKKLDEQFTNQFSQKNQRIQLDFQDENVDNQPDHNHSQSEQDQSLDNQNSNLKKDRLKSEEQQILQEQVRSFKDEYESQENNEDIKFMNLQTIESALKNRLKILQDKKEKQLEKLDQQFSQGKISKQQFNQQKLSIQKWFKHETSEIHSVKKNIWKGYSEAKGILDKFYINSKFQKERKLQQLSKSKKNTFDSKSAEKRDRKMMKCLSQTYLNRKIIDYKGLIEEQERDLEQSQQKYLKRQKYMQEYSSEDESQKYHDKESSSDVELQGWQKDRRSADKFDADDKNIQLQSDDHIEENQTKTRQIQASQFNKLEDQHPASVVSQNVSQVSQQMHSVHDKVHHAHSPSSSNSLSPTMIKYEDVSSQLVAQSQSSGQDDLLHDHGYVDEFETNPEQLKKTQLLQPPHLNIQPISHKQSAKHKSPKSPVSSNVPQQPKQSPTLSKYEQNLIKKLKYLTQDDREDIFEFLFLDLCIEIYQEPCHQNKIMNTVNGFVNKQKQMAKRKKGIKTNLNVIKDYLKRFCGYVMRTHKKLLENVNCPMGPTAKEMLRYMHDGDVDQEPLEESQCVVTLIIPIAVFDTFQRTLLPTIQFDKYYDNEEKQHERINFLKNIMHIHNKALFDALNEFMDQQRPFGIWGKPFPWKKSSSFSHNFTQLEQQQKLKKSAQKVVQSCSYVCGLLVDKEQSLIGNAKVSQGYIEQIREDRISRMLANEMVENQERWVFYDDEQTEVLVEIGNFLYGKLVTQCIQEVINLNQRIISLEE